MENIIHEMDKQNTKINISEILENMIRRQNEFTFRDNKL